MKYNETDSYKKDLKRLLKRFPSLKDDIEIFKKYSIETYFDEKVDTKAFVKIESKCNIVYDSYKVKKFSCKSLKNFGNRSGIRIIFIYNKVSKEVTFVEIYFKGDKENEDSERLGKEILSGPTQKLISMSRDAAAKKGEYSTYDEVFNR